MTEGVGTIHGTFLGFLVVGQSWQKLFFRAEGAAKKQEVAIFDSDKQVRAWRCERCAGVFLAQPPWEPGFDVPPN